MSIKKKFTAAPLVLDNMHPTPKVLVLFLDALMNDDPRAMSALLRERPCMAKKANALTPDERMSVLSASSTTNFFYTCSKESTFGLVAIAEGQSVRALATECHLDKYIRWGTSRETDRPATIADIAEFLQTSKEHETPANVISLFDRLSCDKRRVKRSRS